MLHTCSLGGSCRAGTGGLDTCALAVTCSCGSLIFFCVAGGAGKVKVSPQNRHFPFLPTYSGRACSLAPHWQGKEKVVESMNACRRAIKCAVSLGTAAWSNRSE